MMGGLNCLVVSWKFNSSPTLSDNVFFFLEVY